MSGCLKPGDRLTSVRELAERLSVNPNTVQRAYQELEREGVSETKRGMGSFIVERETLISALKTEMAKTLIKNFIDGMRSLGYSDDEMLKTIGGEFAAGRN